MGETSRLEPVGSVLGDLLRGLGLERRLAEYRAVQIWEAAVGQGIAQHARATAIQDGALFVAVDSSVWMQELALLRQGIVTRLNEQIGAPLVRRIVLGVEQGNAERAGPARRGE
jgi:predicted nucleic acid-binding Zn ribbon protein